MGNDGRLAGKVAIITGASRGLGQYCAVGYAQEGAKVAIAARTEEVKDARLPGTIYETAKMVEEVGGDALPVVCNVADFASVEKMVASVLEHFGQIDILMNNAAVQPPGFISSIEPRHWELEFKVNVHGPFYCARAVLPHMIERKSGNIINISSVAARGGSHYGVTKRALESFTAGLAREQQRNGVAVNALKPVGGIDTPGLRFGRAPGQVGGSNVGSGLPTPDSYVEAAVLLALQTTETCTGEVFNDAEAVERFADDDTKKRLVAG